ncbi:MAG TPA: phospholipid carrier-dependent glycosyltransferase [Abditibacteriaceae bacterium]
MLLNTSQRRSFISIYKSILHKLRSLRGVNLALAIYLVAVFLITFLLTLAPPNGADYDSLTYHLAAPEQYLRAGGIVELPYDHHTYFPFTMEMLYLLGLALQGSVLAKLFHWLMLPLCCFALLAMGRRHLTTRAGLFGAALFASLPLVQSEATTAYVDLGFTAFVLLAFMCFANWLAAREAENNGETNGGATNGGWWLGWSGVFCGFAIGTKYLGFLTFGWLGLWALGTIIRRRNFQIKPLLLFAVWAIVLGGGWYVRNWLWTGNPVFPFAYEIFGGRGWSAQMAADYTRDQVAYGFGRSPSDWLWLPWRFSMAPLNIGVLDGRPVGLPLWPFLHVPPDNGMGGKFEVDALLLQSIIGPALLALSAPLLFVKNKPPVVRFIGWSFAFFWVFWAATSQQVRYILPALGLLCLPCGWAVEKYFNRSAVLKWTTGLALAAWLLFTPLFTLTKASSTLPVIFGQETPDAYLTRTFSGYAAMRWASTNTPPNARFAVYGEPRCFYLQRDYFWADDPHNNLIDYNAIKTGADFVAALRAQRATHILVNTRPGSNGGFGSPPPQMQQAIDGGLVRQLDEARGYIVYEIVAAERPQ